MILEKNQTTQNQKQQQLHLQQMQQSLDAQQLPGGSYDATMGQNQQAAGVGLAPGSAAASLAMLSQRHNTHTGTPGAMGDPSVGGAEQQKGGTEATGSSTLAGGYPMGQMNGMAGNVTALAFGQALQSPTARRKNYNFVPIADASARMGSVGKNQQQQQQQQQQPQHQQQSSNSNINHTPTASPFVSPRSTPIHRKAHKPVNGLTLNLLEHKFNNSHQQQQQQQQQQQHLHQQLQLAGSYHQQLHPRASMGYIKNELPASAPPSPSVLQQQYRFGPGMNGLSCGMSSMPTSFQPICAPHANNASGLSGGANGLLSSLESRSSSVPLIPNYDGYCNSNYNSVSQTPVPSEYDDFTDTGNILDMLNEQSSQLTSSIKIEEAELTLPELLQQQQQQQHHQDGGFFSRASNYNIISRSVPSTPLPHHAAGMGFNGGISSTSTTGCIGAGSIGNAPSGGGGLGLGSKSMFELPKSVPSTPITLNDGCHEPLFQYSPETSRDFLINGNSVDRSKSSAASFYSGVSGVPGSALPGADTDANGNVTGEQHHHHHHRPSAAGSELHTAGGVSTGDPIAPPTAEIPNLTDGIEGLSNDLDSVTDSIIDSDILQNL
uniref:Uncharacterized protein n=1 Tax=Anopheles atroparvus TaxID=41427 RepID=A0A182IUD5_ANOAO